MAARYLLALGLVVGVFVSVGGASASSPGTDVRLTNDCLVPTTPDPVVIAPPTCAVGGYVSAYTLAHPGTPINDAIINECSGSHRQQNEPSVAVDPRNTSVLIGSSNDACGVNLGVAWLGYYRSENGGSSFESSLVPGYPGDGTPFAALAHVRTSGSGDPVIAWDGHGRVFLGSESSGDPAGTAKTFGDVWVARYENPGGPNGATINDGKLYKGTETVEQGSAAPNLLGKFNDKTAIEADRTGGPCDGNVYFAWARFTGGSGNGFNSSVYLARSTDHGQTFSSPMKLSQTVHDIQFPDIAVTANGHVYITFRQFADVRSNEATDAVMYVKSSDCGQTFSQAKLIAPFEPYDAADVPDPKAPPAAPLPDEEPLEGAGQATLAAGTCGDFDTHCASGYTFFRRSTQVRSTADQSDTQHEWIYIVYDPSKPGTEVNSDSTYGSIVSGDLPIQYHQNKGSQSGIYFIRLNGATGTHTAPKLIDPEAVGHQLFPDISADGGTLHTIWWDSRNDACYSPKRPVGNCANLSTVPALDVFAATSGNNGDTWSTASRVSDATTNPNYEQFFGRGAPFAGDYLWVTSVGSFAYTTWTDWRNTVAGSDPRESGDADADAADVLQCRVAVSPTAWSGDRCPRAGGVDQNIYGDLAP